MVDIILGLIALGGTLAGLSVSVSKNGTWKQSAMIWIAIAAVLWIRCLLLVLGA